ncbi:MAG: hypothetical protein ACW981_15680 [Candidatus Hodarchaeales archaeon]|jgi:hypothetical protein
MIEFTIYKHKLPLTIQKTGLDYCKSMNSGKLLEYHIEVLTEKWIRASIDKITFVFFSTPIHRE